MQMSGAQAEGTAAAALVTAGGTPGAPRSVTAIVAQATRSPAGAISSKVAIDAIKPVLLQRWDWEAVLSAEVVGSGQQLAPRFGGWLSDIELFDAMAFGISGVEAQLMDAQQRMLLELSLETLAEASSSAAATYEEGISTVAGALASIPGLPSACVAVGIASAEYNNYLLRRTGSPQSAYSATGGALSVASGRLSFTFGMKGAALSVDTACSSSLVATHFAAGQLTTGVSSAALAAGVGILLSPDPSGMFQTAGRTSAAWYYQEVAC